MDIAILDIEGLNSDVNKDFSHKDQDQVKDLSNKEQDKDFKNFTSKDKDNDCRLHLIARYKSLSGDEIPERDVTYHLM